MVLLDRNRALALAPTRSPYPRKSETQGVLNASAVMSHFPSFERGMVYYTLFANICQVKYVVNYNYEDSGWVSPRI